MARPRKMTTEQMLSVVDSYYATKVEGNTKLMKCSLIAIYATELGYFADGYDFRRNIEVRDYIESLKSESEFHDEETIVVAFKNLDVVGFIRNHSSIPQLTQALTDLNNYWKQIYDYAEKMHKQHSALIKEKKTWETKTKELSLSLEKLENENVEISLQNNKLVIENRYLRRMLRTHLYPAIANEILVQENTLSRNESGEISDITLSDMTELGSPKSLHEAVSKDISMQSEEEQLIAKMWELCDE